MAKDPEVGPSNPPYFIATLFVAYGIIYNPKYVKGEIVHWKDVLRSEYKGKISCGDVSKSYSYTNAYLAIRKVVGTEFFEELGKRKPFVVVSVTQLIDKCTTGEFPIAVIVVQGTTLRYILKGAEIKYVLPPEGYGLVGYPAVILAHAPHPNAAKLFQDFIHGEVGQRFIFNEAGFPVGRLGIKSKYTDPNPAYPKLVRDRKGFIEMDWRRISSKDRLNAREEFRRLVIEKK